jgi:hypothetical protein
MAPQQIIWLPQYQQMAVRQYTEGYLVQKKRAEHAGYFEYGFRVRGFYLIKWALI